MPTYEAFTFSIIFRLFPNGGEKKIASHFAPSGWMCAPRHVGRIFRAKNRRSDLPVFNMKHNLAKKLDLTLKPSYFKEKTYLTHFYAQKSKCPRRL